MVTINQRIKEVRTSLGLSQLKFAKAIGMTDGFIAGIESEKRTVNDRLIILICNVFDVEETWLKTGEGNMFVEHPERLLELASSSFSQLTPQYQEFVLKIIDQLIEMQNKEI